jgi:hypothetical protein
MTEHLQTERVPVERALTAGGGALVGAVVLWWILVTNSLTWPTVGWQVASAWAAVAVVGGCSWMAQDAAKDAWPDRNKDVLDFSIVVGICGLILAGVAATVVALAVAGGSQIDGREVATSVAAAATDGGLPAGAEVTCPDRMIARDGREDTCRFTAPDGSSGSVSLRWEGDDGRYTWFAEGSGSE